MNNRDIIIAPIISEKSMKDAKDGKFTFKVGMASNKKTIKQAIEKQFSVNVLDVATMVVKGKSARAGKRRVEVLQSAWKKAVVTLGKEQKISLFDIGGK